ncbi:MAG: DUF507 family protein [bacterium]|nr:DUF507 family protein [Candidatus Sumerlaeota bacterium]
MRLSQDRINFIAQQVAMELIDKGYVKYSGSKVLLESEIAKVILEDLAIEDEIDREVVDMITSMKRNIPAGSAEWNAIYWQKKEEIARRRNYTI